MCSFLLYEQTDNLLIITSLCILFQGHLTISEVVKCKQSDRQFVQSGNTNVLFKINFGELNIRLNKFAFSSLVSEDEADLSDEERVDPRYVLMEVTDIHEEKEFSSNCTMGEWQDPVEVRFLFGA